jgi:DNA-binding transcriptional regulator YiaG
MNMAKNFKELRAGMSASSTAVSAAEHRRLVDEMSLLQLRKARELTQTKIADELHMGQGVVSKLERRIDMYVGTLASCLQAVGADLEIRALFPDGRAIRITQFSEESTWRSD